MEYSDINARLMDERTDEIDDIRRGTILGQFEDGKEDNPAEEHKLADADNKPLGESEKLEIREGHFAKMSVGDLSGEARKYAVPHSRSDARKRTISVGLREVIRVLATVVREYLLRGDQISVHNRVTRLFYEGKYANKTWSISLFSGFCPTVPMIKYQNFRKKYQVLVPELEEVIGFIEDIYTKIHPNPECAIISLIYIEKLMVTCGKR